MKTQKNVWILLLSMVWILSIVMVINSQEQIAVIMPRHEMDVKGLWEQQTREFEKETGIKVELITMAWDRVADKVLTELAAGGTSFDVIEFDNAWVAKFNEAGWLVPLNQYMEADVIDQMLPGLVNTFSVDGTLYGIVWNNDTRFFMYNGKKLKDAGIAEPPHTWAEFVEQSQKMITANLIQYGSSEAAEQSQSLANWHTFISYSFGSDLFNNEGKPTFLEQPAIDALTFMADCFLNTKVIDPASLTMNQEMTANVFYNGSTAFFPQAWPGVYNASNDPSISQIVGEIEIAEYIPAVKPEYQATLNLPEALAIPATSKNPEAAWKYIEYMTSPERDKVRSLEIGTLPIWKAHFEDPELLALYPYWKNFGKQAEFARALPQLTWYDEWSYAEQIEVQNALMGTKTPQEALQSMYDAIEKNIQ